MPITAASVYNRLTLYCCIYSCMPLQLRPTTQHPDERWTLLLGTSPRASGALCVPSAPGQLIVLFPVYALGLFSRLWHSAFDWSVVSSDKHLHLYSVRLPRSQHTASRDTAPHPGHGNRDGLLCRFWQPPPAGILLRSAYVCHVRDSAVHSIVVVRNDGFTRRHIHACR